MPVTITHTRDDRAALQCLCERIYKFIIDYKISWTPATGCGFAQEHPKMNDFCLLSSEAHQGYKKTDKQYSNKYVDENGIQVDHVDFRYVMATIKIKGEEGKQKPSIDIEIHGKRFEPDILALANAIDNKFEFEIYIHVDCDSEVSLEERQSYFVPQGTHFPPPYSRS